MSKEATRPNHPKRFGLLLFIGGLVGFFASFDLTLERVRLLQNPSYEPSCNLNPIISCGSVMKTHQAEIFGFANSLLGVAAFSIIIFVGLAILANAKFQKWFWLLFTGLVTGGFGFMVWLVFQSLYRLGTLCPYCVAVWIVMLPIWWYTVLSISRMFAGVARNKVFSWIDRHHGDLLICFYLILIGLILHRFWYYWQTLI